MPFIDVYYLCQTPKPKHSLKACAPLQLWNAYFLSLLLAATCVYRYHSNKSFIVIISIISVTKVSLCSRHDCDSMRATQLFISVVVVDFSCIKFHWRQQHQGMHVYRNCPSKELQPVSNFVVVIIVIVFFLLVFC